MKTEGNQILPLTFFALFSPVVPRGGVRAAAAAAAFTVL